jgi:hypothetical protein
MQHPWFLKNLPKDLALGSDPIYDNDRVDTPLQSIDEVMKIIKDAMIKPSPAHSAYDTSSRIDNDEQEVEQINQMEAEVEPDPIPNVILQDEEETEYFDVEEYSEFDPWPDTR